MLCRCDSSDAPFIRSCIRGSRNGRPYRTSKTEAIIDKGTALGILDAHSIPSNSLKSWLHTFLIQPSTTHVICLGRHVSVKERLRPMLATYLRIIYMWRVAPTHRTFLTSEGIGSRPFNSIATRHDRLMCCYLMMTTQTTVLNVA